MKHRKVAATLALVISLGAGAAAAPQITSAQAALPKWQADHVSLLGTGPETGIEVKGWGWVKLSGYPIGIERCKFHFGGEVFDPTSTLKTVVGEVEGERVFHCRQEATEGERCLNTNPPTLGYFKVSVGGAERGALEPTDPLLLEEDPATKAWQLLFNPNGRWGFECQRLASGKLNQTLHMWCNTSLCRGGAEVGGQAFGSDRDLQNASSMSAPSILFVSGAPMEVFYEQENSPEVWTTEWKLRIDGEYNEMVTLK
jgi:hypothetical protein